MTICSPTCRWKRSPSAISANSRASRRCARSSEEKLEKADQLNYDLFERETRTRIDEDSFKPYLYAIRTFDGPQLLPELAEVHPFQTVKDYDNWIARINGSGAYIDQWIAVLTGITTVVFEIRLEHVQPRVRHRHSRRC